MQASNLAQAGHGFFALAHSMNMHGRAAAIVSSIGDKKRLFRADSVVSSSGCAGRDRVKSGSSRKNKWKHARLQGAQRREGVCVGLGCRGGRVQLLWTSRGYVPEISAPLGMGGAAPSTYKP